MTQRASEKPARDELAVFRAILDLLSKLSYEDSFAEGKRLFSLRWRDVDLIRAEGSDFSFRMSYSAFYDRIIDSLQAMLEEVSESKKRAAKLLYFTTDPNQESEDPSVVNLEQERAKKGELREKLMKFLDQTLDTYGKCRPKFSIKDGVYTSEMLIGEDVFFRTTGKDYEITYNFEPLLNAVRGLILAEMKESLRAVG